MSYPGLGITRIRYDGSNLSHLASLRSVQWPIQTVTGTAITAYLAYCSAW